MTTTIITITNLEGSKFLTSAAAAALLTNSVVPSEAEVEVDYSEEEALANNSSNNSSPSTMAAIINLTKHTMDITSNNKTQASEVEA